MFNTSSKKINHQMENVNLKIGLVFIMLIGAVFFMPDAIAETVQANEQSTTENEEPMFQEYDKAPEIIGGVKELAKHLVYPESAKKERIQGKVVLEIVVDKSGQVQNTKVVKSFGNAECDAAAVDAVNKVKWKPAYQKEQAVTASVAIPIVFKLK
jgi:TonB family protein